MEDRPLRMRVGLVMLVLGLIQAGLGVVRNEVLFALLGLLYAGLGGAYFWFEGYTSSQ